MARKNKGSEEVEELVETSARPDQGPTAWTLTVPGGPAKDFEKAATKADAVVTAPSAEGRAQVAAAINAATALVAVIQPDGEKNVAATLSGYANPGGVVGQSGTVDQVTVKIRQA